jgi:hypothetical protein
MVWETSRFGRVRLKTMAGVGLAAVVMFMQAGCGAPGEPDFNLVWADLDDNGTPMSPKWQWQASHPGVPDTANFCNGKPWNQVGIGQRCTTQLVTPNDSVVCIAVGDQPGHENWRVATYQGSLCWENHSLPVNDDDYSFNLNEFAVPVRAVPSTPLLPILNGLTTRNNGRLTCEFNSSETIDHFKSPWWMKFHDAVDKGDGPFGDGYRQAKALFDGNFAIVTGLIGLDTAHPPATESHPVYAMAIQSHLDRSEDVWVFFVRNYGDEGYCGKLYSPLVTWPNNQFTFRLPWKPGATAVSVTGPQFYANYLNAFPQIIWSPNEGVLVTFPNIPPGTQQEARVNGELHLKWDSESVVVFPPCGRRQASVDSEKEDQEPEKIVARIIADMTPRQLSLYYSKFPNKLTTYDPEVPPTPWYVKRMTNLPPLPTAEMSTVLYTVPDAEQARKAELQVDALKAAFGGLRRCSGPVARTPTKNSGSLGFQES